MLGSNFFFVQSYRKFNPTGRVSALRKCDHNQSGNWLLSTFLHIIIIRIKSPYLRVPDVLLLSRYEREREQQVRGVARIFLPDRGTCSALRNSEDTSSFILFDNNYTIFVIIGMIKTTKLTELILWKITATEFENERTKQYVLKWDTFVRRFLRLSTVGMKF